MQEDARRPYCVWRRQVTRKSGSRRWMLFAGLAAVVTLVAAAAFFPYSVSGEDVEAGGGGRGEPRGGGGVTDREGDRRGEILTATSFHSVNQRLKSPSSLKSLSSPDTTFSTNQVDLNPHPNVGHSHVSTPHHESNQTHADEEMLSRQAWTKSIVSPGSRLEGSTSEGRKSRAHSRLAAKALAESTASRSGEYSNAPVVKGVWLREVRPEDINAGAHDFRVDKVKDTDSRRLEEADDGKSGLVRAVEGLVPEEIRKYMDDKVEGEDYTAAAKKYKRATSNVEQETERSQWDWLEGLFTGDIRVAQRSMSPGETVEGGWQGSQEGGVVVDWDIPRRRYFPPAGGNRESRAVPRIMHRADGRILETTQPVGYVLPYRAPTRSIVFRPCKRHPVKGCEVEPGLPPDSLRPQMPAEPPVKFVHHEVIDSPKSTTVSFLPISVSPILTYGHPCPVRLCRAPPISPLFLFSYPSPSLPCFSFHTPPHLSLVPPCAHFDNRPRFVNRH